MLKVGNNSYLTGAMHVDQSRKIARIAFDQAHEDDFAEAALAVDLTAVAANSRTGIEAIRQQNQLQQLFRTGLQGLKHPLKSSQPAQLLVSDYTLQGAMSPKMKKIGMLFNSADSHPAVNALSNLGFVFTLLPDED